MPITYLGTDIIESIRQQGMIPSTGSLGVQGPDLLRYASEGIRGFAMAKVANVREEYFLMRSRLALGTTALYRLPGRAMWQKLRDLWHVDTQGTRLKITPAEEEEMHGNYVRTSTNPSNYLIEGNYVRLLPDLSPSWSGSLEFVFYARPGDLVLETEARQISTIDTVTNTVTFATAIPSDWSTETSFDVHSEQSGAELKGFALAGVASASQVVFSAAIDGSVFGTHPMEVGDWVCLEGEAALPALPMELHPIVSRIAALQFAEAISDTEKAALHSGIVQTFLAENLKTLEQRVEGKPMRIGGFKGLLGRGGRTWRGW